MPATKLSSTARTRLYKLPFRRLSSLIVAAVADLTKVERRKKTYKVNMCEWHTPKSEFREKCSVCFAGAVMACRAGVGMEVPEIDFLDHDCIPEGDAAKYRALNWARAGNVSDAIDAMHGVAERRRVQEDINFFRSVVVYDEHPKLFKQQMLKLAADLKRVGL
jgi:hypothetical protein